MSYPDDLEAYQKGYEDAMRAAGEGRTPASTSPGTGPTTGTGADTVGRKVGSGLAYAFGWLIAAPILLGGLAGGIAWLLGGDFGAAALVVGGIAFVFLLFAGVVIVGWRLFLTFWPVVVLAVIVWVIVRAVLG